MNRFQKILLWVTSGLTGVTGAVYFVMDRMMEPVGPWAVVNHPLQPWVLKLHIIVAPALIFSIGLIATEHIWKHYRGRVRRARRTGLATMWMIAPMVVTGYLIQAITQQPLLSTIAWAHIVTGVIYLLVIGLHQWALRLARANGAVAYPRTDAQTTPSPANGGSAEAPLRATAGPRPTRRSLTPRRAATRTRPHAAK